MTCMCIRQLFVNLIILCSTVACTEQADRTSVYDSFKAVVVTPQNSIRNESIPLEITEIVESLKFRNSDEDEKALGVSPKSKIEIFNVVAYVEYEDGWLIASGRGEWGGIVFWIDKKGGYEIIRDDYLAYPIDVMTDGNTVLIIQGMLHLGLADGHLLEINRNNGTFSAHIYPLIGYPSVYTQSNGKWIIPVVSHQGYYEVSELLTGKRLFHNNR